MILEELVQRTQDFIDLIFGVRNQGVVDLELESLEIDDDENPMFADIKRKHDLSLAGWLQLFGELFLEGLLFLALRVGKREGIVARENMGIKDVLVEELDVLVDDLITDLVILDKAVV